MNAFFDEEKGLPLRQDMITKLVAMVDDWDLDALLEHVKASQEDFYDNLTTLDLYHYYYKLEVEETS